MPLFQGKAVLRSDALDNVAAGRDRQESANTGLKAGDSDEPAHSTSNDESCTGKKARVAINRDGRTRFLPVPA